jgi:hypothetical protein
LYTIIASTVPLEGGPTLTRLPSDHGAVGTLVFRLPRDCTGGVCSFVKILPIGGRKMRGTLPAKGACAAVRLVTIGTIGLPLRLVPRLTNQLSSNTGTQLPLA